jgi:hypothetical protein
MGGGDLLNLLIERDVFPEDFTRFYVAEVNIFFFLLSLSYFPHAILQPSADVYYFNFR